MNAKNLFHNIIMPKKLIKKYIPNPKEVREHKSLRFLSVFFSNPNLWHVNRISTQRAFSIGLFWAFIPIPFQMVFAAISSVVFKANIPISVALVWLTNPLTMVPIFYAAYLLGTSMLGIQTGNFNVELSWTWVTHELPRVWKPLLVGSLTLATSFSVMAYFLMDVIWRLNIYLKLKKRKNQLPK
jgi:uncharacterized protein (DUF2062 family)